jgi:stress response protein SCP2
MSVTLPKGGNLQLAAAAPGLRQVRVELGWRDLPGGPSALEVDGVIVVDHAGAAGGSPEVLLAHQTPNPGEGAVTSAAAAAGRPCAETLVVTLAAIPPGITRLRLGAAIFDAAARGQTFRAVGDPYIRVLNQADGAEIARYDVAPETGQETVMIFGELYRHAGSWKFRAVGQGYTNGLPGLVEHGHEVEPARPADIAAFLTRSSPTRSRRKVADHLHPARPVTPAASPAPGRPAPSRPSAQRPPTGGARPGVLSATRDATPSRRAAPTRTAGAAPPGATRAGPAGHLVATRPGRCRATWRVRAAGRAERPFRARPWRRRARTAAVRLAVLPWSLAA